MNLQEIFDRAYTGVIAQGAPGVDKGGACAYIGEVGGKEVRCALGQLVEGQAVYDMQHIHDVIEHLIPLVEGWSGFSAAERFLFQLRAAHDDAVVAARGDTYLDVNNKIFTEEFKARMQMFAAAHNLKFPE